MTTSSLLLPSKFIDEKTSLKNELNKLVEQAVNSVKWKENYFLTLHAKFDLIDPSLFIVSQMVACLRIPPITSNSMVFWVSPSRGILEILWMVAAKKPNEKLKVEFNKTGVAYLQAKGAMPS